MHRATNSGIEAEIIYRGLNSFQTEPNVDGKWLSEGDSIQSTGGRIEIEQITADHLVTFRNGVRRWVRFGESLEPEPSKLPRYAPDRDPRLDQFAADATPAWGVS